MNPTKQIHFKNIDLIFSKRLSQIVKVTTEKRSHQFFQTQQIFLKNDLKMT